jgi:hypothetical protein
MANRKNRAAARKSAPVVIVNDPVALDAERMLDDANAIIDAPEVADKVLDSDLVATEIEIVQAPTEGSSITGLVEIIGTPEGADAEALENNPDVIDSTETDTSLTAPVAPEAQDGDLTDQAKALARETTEGRMLATPFETAEEAFAYAGNMKLKNLTYTQIDGKWRITLLGRALAMPHAQPQTVTAPTPKRAPKARTPRVKASGPRPDTRNAVIWAMLTRPEGTTKKEVDAALAAFQPENIQPCGIGSDAKLFSGRFGYDWRKEADGDATRYFCFKTANAEVASAPEVERATESEIESASSEA